jgi:hypothetical protein
MVRTRTDLFDFSASALAAGGVTSLALFLAGLAASHGGATPEVSPVLPIPALPCPALPVAAASGSTQEGQGRKQRVASGGVGSARRRLERCK